MQNRFIVLEGGEGAGKTGLLAFLADALTNSGHDVLQTREPGGTPEGMELRALLLADRGIDWDPAAELLMMTAARVQHVKHIIRPALDAGRVVLCDRFIGSTLAYQGAGRGFSEAAIRQLHQDYVGDLMPDTTILLDIDPEIGLRRSRARLQQQHQDEGRFEALALDFHRRVRQSFLDQADARTIVVDAGRAQDDVRAEVLGKLGKAFFAGRKELKDF